MEKNRTMGEICSKLLMKTLEQSHWRRWNNVILIQTEFFLGQTVFLGIFALKKGDFNTRTDFIVNNKKHCYIINR